jgi:Flp pilus assembly pilin Flp
MRCSVGKRRMIVRTSRFFARLMCEDSGATAIEYGFLLSILSVGILATWQVIGAEMTGVFTPIIINLGYHGVIAG